MFVAAAKSSNAYVAVAAAATSQIPLRLCKSLVRALRHFGGGRSSSSLASADVMTIIWDSRLENMLRFTSSALMLLGNNAVKLAVREANCLTSRDSGAAGVPPRVNAGFMQQLEASGMLQCLPDILVGAAKTLAQYTSQVRSS